MIPDLIISRFQGYTFDGDHFCEECLDVDVDDERVGYMAASESHDSPPHCSFCRRPLKGSLSKEAIESVIEDARDWLKGDADDREDLIELTNLGLERCAADWYRGSRAPAVTRDWAAWILQNHCVSGRDKRFLELFLHYTRPRSRLELAMLRTPTALRPYVDEAGEFMRYVDGGYPLVYTNGDSEWYHPACARELWLNATGRERPIKEAHELAEVGDDGEGVVAWPTCDECEENLEVSYPPDGYTSDGKKEGES